MKPPELPTCHHQPKPYKGPSLEDVSEMWKCYLMPSLITFYQTPVMTVEGAMQYVWDEKGRRYLDAFAGIVTVSVGHCHPYVTQMARDREVQKKKYRKRY